MEFGRFRLHPKQATRRVLRAIVRARGVRSKLDTFRCVKGWALTKFRRPARSRNVILDFGPVRLALDTGRAELIPYLEIWEEHCYDSVAGFSVDRPDCVVDVGANVGIFALYQAIRKKAKNVIAFEPAPSVFPRLLRNLEINAKPNVKAVNAAVGDFCGTVDFVETPMSLNCHIATNVETASVRVPCLTLDSLLGHIRKIDLLKIDVEGFETSVLRGAMGTLTKTHRVVLEVTGNCDREGVHELLAFHGFRFIAQHDDIFFYARE